VPPAPGFFAMPPINGVQGLSISWDFGAFPALIAPIVAAPVIYPLARSYLDSRRGERRAAVLDLSRRRPG
jgi:hypothetical protein